MRDATLAARRSGPLVLLALALALSGALAQEAAEPIVSDETAACLACHGPGGAELAAGAPGIAQQWAGSAHAAVGVGCAECHAVPKPGAGTDADNPRYVVETRWDRDTGLKTVALATDDGRPRERPDVWTHQGSEIVVNVSPRTCATCHGAEAREFHGSRHASAAQFLGSIDNFLGRYAEGPAAAVSGCQQCHGSEVRVSHAASGEAPPKYAADTWPNTGMGRVNADGSWGSCTACHSRHAFSPGVARRPDNCGRCHLGPDHPQAEVYRESKHGIAFRATEASIGIDRPGLQWVLGKDYSQAPTCSSCHMGPVAARGESPGLSMTHNAGARIAWTLRPEVSVQPGAIVGPDGRVVLGGPEQRRADMRTTCQACHAPSWASSFFTQFDNAVDLYNSKYGEPAKAIYAHLKDRGAIDAVPMNEPMDFIYFELWHHEGRRARHGAAMMGPDYVQWHGFYDLSKRLYAEFLPLARDLGAKAGVGDDIAGFIDATLRGPDGRDWERYHAWTEGLSPEQSQRLLELEREAYGDRQPAE